MAKEATKEKKAKTAAKKDSKAKTKAKAAGNKSKAAEAEKKAKAAEADEKNTVESEDGKEIKQIKQPAGARVVGDDVEGPAKNPFHLHPSEGLFQWLSKENMSIALSTYEAGKVVMMGPGFGKGIAVSERSFGHAMALLPTDDGFWLSTKFQVWKFQNGLKNGRIFDGWDRLYMPRRSHVTGGVDTHDLALDKDGRMLAVITLYNCVAELTDDGNFNPIWRPPFIDKIIAEDRCHLNGFCLEDGELAYVTLIGEANEKDGWRQLRTDGGIVMDTRTNKVVCKGLSMPHSPRLYRGKLWVCEAGTGYFGWVDQETGEFKKLTWCPGFLRGLRFHGDYAFIGLSKPRNKVFHDLPLEDELKSRDMEPECGLYIVNIKSGHVLHKVTISGSVQELYDVMGMAQTRSPFLIGTQGDEISKYVYLGPDGTKTEEEKETAAA